MGHGTLDPLPPHQTLNEYLAPTGDILHDLAAAQIQVSQVMSDSLQLQRKFLMDISQEINSINKLMDELRSKKLTGQDASDGSKDADLAATEEEARKLVARVKAMGVDVGEYKGGKSVKQSTIDKWLTSLQAKSDGLGTDSQKMQTEIQQTMGRYNQGFDAGTSLARKKGELGDAIAGNVRAA